MSGDVIKSFLVGLGFDVDDSSLAKFNKAIESATIKVAALYASIQIAAAGIFKGISGISEGFEEMGYSLRLVAPAVNKMLILRQAMISAYAAAGINLTRAVQQSIKFNYTLAKTKFALEAAYKSVGIKFIPLLTKQMDIFRLKILQNMPKIQATLEKLVNFIFKAFDATVELGSRLWSILGRVYDFFVKLDEATNGWSTKILALIAIWKFLNLSFLATPLGMIISGFLTLLALYDDFKVWQEGGRALINWGSDATQMILGLVTAVAAITAAFYAWKTATTILSGVSAAFEAVLAVLDGELTIAAAAAAILEAPIWLIVGAVAALAAALTALDAKWNIFGGALSNTAKNIGSGVINLLGGGPKNTQANNGISGVMNPPPLVNQGTGVNQKVNQETNIIVQGSADANSVGKAVAGEQNKVNFDMTRNLKGNAR